MSDRYHLCNGASVFYRAFVTILLLQVYSTQADVAEEQTFMPARFGTGADSIIDNVQCPVKLNKKRVVEISCQVAVDEKGNTHDSGIFCYGASKNDRAYVQAVETAAQKSIFLPASVNGEAKKVSFPFRMLFHSKDGICTVMAIPNLGFGFDKYGNQYFSPQELRSGPHWYKKKHQARYVLSNLRRSGRLARPHRGILMAASVSDQGKVDSVKLYVNGPYAPTIKTAMFRLKRTNFIPGFYEGQPTAMSYSAFLYP